MRYSEYNNISNKKNQRRNKIFYRNKIKLICVNPGTKNILKFVFSNGETPEIE